MKLLSGIIVSALFLVSSMVGANGEKLSTELAKLHSDTALIMGASGIDEHPMWSPNSDHVAANVMGRWIVFNLNKAKLSGATWHGKQIGVAEENEAFFLLHPSEEATFKKTTPSAKQEIETKTGLVVGLRAKGLGTQFSFTRKGKTPVVQWASDLDLCHSLALSPNEVFVAFICEANGLFVTQLP